MFEDIGKARRTMWTVSDTDRFYQQPNKIGLLQDGSHLSAMRLLEHTCACTSDLVFVMTLLGLRENHVEPHSSDFKQSRSLRALRH